MNEKDRIEQEFLAAFEDGDVSRAHACHCKQCLRQSGHFAVSVDVRRADFSLTSDTGLKWFRSSDFARRGFCANCGSAILWDDGGDRIIVSTGSMDNHGDLKLESHIFVDEKPDYYSISDGLPQFAGYDQPFDGS